MVGAAVGPFETEREAIAASRPVREWPGDWAVGNLAMLAAACHAAGVELGAHDARVVEWLSRWEPETCAVIAGLITRAADTRA